MEITIVNGIFLLIGVFLGGIISLISGLMTNKSQKEQLRAQFIYQTKVKWLDDLSSCIVKLRDAMDSYASLKLQIHFIRNNEITAVYNLMNLSEAAQTAQKYLNSIGPLAGEYSILLSQDSEESKSLKKELAPLITDLKKINLTDSNVVSDYSEKLRLYTDKVEIFIQTEKNNLSSII